MPVITIPFDYDERTHPDVIPICVEDTDRNGSPIHPDWFRLGIAPAADDLRRIAKRLLHDVWRASEIADSALKSAWKKRGCDVGPRPELVISSNALWAARNLRAGDRRARIGKDVELFAMTLDRLQDRVDMVSQAEDREIIEKLENQLRALGLHQEADMVPMMIQGCSRDEYIERFSKRRNTLTQAFFRGMRKAAQTSKVTW